MTSETEKGYFRNKSSVFQLLISPCLHVGTSWNTYMSPNRNEVHSVNCQVLWHDMWNVYDVFLLHALHLYWVEEESCELLKIMNCLCYAAWRHCCCDVLFGELVSTFLRLSLESNAPRTCWKLLLWKMKENVRVSPSAVLPLLSE